MKERFYNELKKLGITEKELKEVIEKDVYNQFRLNEFYDDCHFFIVDEVAFGKFAFQLEKECMFTFSENDNGAYFIEKFEDLLTSDFYRQFGERESEQIQRSEYFTKLGKNRYLIVKDS